jgi:hypothetical protein
MTLPIHFGGKQPMSAEQDFSQIHSYLRKTLPELLQQPEILTTIEDIFARQYPRRDEFLQVLNEIKLLRSDTQQELKQVEKRMVQVEQRMVQVEQRMEQVEQRMEQVEKRVVQVEKRLEQQHEEMIQRFEQVDRRFEQVDRQFEQMREEMNRRFEQMREETNHQFEQMREETNRRFEQVDRRFDEQHRETLDIKRRMIKMESNMGLMVNRMDKFDAWLNVIHGNIGTDKGQKLEELFALGLSYGLKDREILPETIQLRQKFVDIEGLIYQRQGQYIEVDLIAENGKLTVFEVKATAVPEDAYTLSNKVKLIQQQNPDKHVEGILISPWPADGVKKWCAEYNVKQLPLKAVQ